MPRINILSPHVADLIAAGEVVERPASAVKELVENAIDAGARNITVEISGGGAELIRVTDDGCGMSAEDAGVAFLRHATSKLHDERGLEAIGTLGFRGEALAAISSVSHIELSTCERGAMEGTYMRLDAGDIMEMRPDGAPEGTSIAVRGLFYNTPARRKFLKSDRAEGVACVQAAMRCALGRPDVSIRCIRDGKEEFFTPGDSRAESAIYALLGRDIALGMLPVASAEGLGPVRASGFTGSPSTGRRQPQRAVFLRERPVYKEPAPAGGDGAGVPRHAAHREVPQLRDIPHAERRGGGRERPPDEDGGQVLRRARGVQRRALRRAGRAGGKARAGRGGGAPAGEVRRRRRPGRGGAGAHAGRRAALVRRIRPQGGPREPAARSRLTARSPACRPAST